MRAVRNTVFVFVTLFLPAAGQIKTNDPPERDLRVHILESRIFNNTRKIRVLLPPGYGEPGNSRRFYPVLYLNDGQNLFDAKDSLFTGKEWRVDETVHELITKKEIEPIIVVGIDNAGIQMRPNEYLPWEDEYLTPAMPDPHGAQYPEFLEKEVIPFVEENYRASAMRFSRVLGGSSYGGLIAVYSGIEKPYLFGSFLIESPSFYVGEAKVLGLAAKWSPLPLKIYLGVGTNEMGKKDCGPDDDGGEAVSDVRRMETILKNERLDRSRLKVVVEECAIHIEDAWARRLPDALRFLFPSK